MGCIFSLLYSVTKITVLCVFLVVLIVECLAGGLLCTILWTLPKKLLSRLFWSGDDAPSRWTGDEGQSRQVYQEPEEAIVGSQITLSRAPHLHNGPGGDAVTPICERSMPWK
ncbi:hypothetical protein BC835DRAFT_1302892 [Cytidiella melzeri]|nr:hypothetical protein BC835DRAFT_1302892 [Cytidiella melzeri]